MDEDDADLERDEDDTDLERDEDDTDLYQTSCCASGCMECLGFTWKDFF